MIYFWRKISVFRSENIITDVVKLRNESAVTSILWKKRNMVILWKMGDGATLKPNK